MMGFIHLLVLLKSYENRFAQMIINKKRFSKIKKIQKDSHKKNRFSKMIAKKYKSIQINS